MPGSEEIEPIMQNRKKDPLAARMERYAKRRPRHCRLLVISPHAYLSQFMRSPTSQVLAWGLDRNGIEWRQHDLSVIPTDADRYDALLFWPYGLKRRPGFLRYCAAIEKAVKDQNVTILNSLRRCNFRHTWCLRLWREAGIPCAPFQKVKHWKEIRLDYPLILRTDRLHRGRNMFLVHNAREARRVFASASPPIDLAVEFIDTRWSDGIYRKWRSFVIGDAVVPRNLEMSQQWKVNLHAAELLPKTVRENRHFLREDDPLRSLIIRAARALKADILALDYARLEDGNCIFWEANRSFDLATGGEMWNTYKHITGRSDKQCANSLKILGDCLANFVIQRCRLANIQFNGDTIPAHRFQSAPFQEIQQCAPWRP